MVLLGLLGQKVRLGGQVDRGGLGARTLDSPDLGGLVVVRDHYRRGQGRGQQLSSVVLDEERNTEAELLIVVATVASEPGREDGVARAEVDCFPTVEEQDLLLVNHEPRVL